MRIDRKDFLQRLLCVSPGISNRETIQQSSCIVFRNGRLYTMSTEVACSLKSNLPEELEAAIPAEIVTNLIKLYPDDELDLEMTDSHLLVKGKGKKSKVAIMGDIVLPIDDVERPETWAKDRARLF